MKRYNKCSGYDEGYDDGYDDGAESAPDDGSYDDGQRQTRLGLLEEIDKRKRGAALPHPIYSDTMTLDEVEQLIRRL